MRAEGKQYVVKDGDVLNFQRLMARLDRFFLSGVAAG